MSPLFDPSEVEALFDAAIDQSNDRRRAFLEAQCAGRPELLREVWSLLQSDDAQPGEFLKSTAVALAPPDEATSPASRIGRFAVLSKVGEGGMGVVYAAYDDKLDRRVALKLIPLERVDLEGRARLVREAQAMAKLSHPNVVPIYEIGEHEGRVFVAMEFVDGRTLRAFCGEAPRAWEEVLAAGIQAGRGLAAAHQKGLVHRDIKPDNILIGKDGRARVADFGLARLRGDEDRPPSGRGPSAGVLDKSPLQAPLTADGTFMGTPAYMAPEQAERLPATALSDQWSFCAVLYEALYGELPFEGESLDARLDRVRRGLLRPASPGSKVPSWVRGALARGLRARPEERWPSLDDLLSVLADQLAKSSDIDLTVSKRERIRFGLLIGALASALAMVVLGRVVRVVRPVHLFGLSCVVAFGVVSLLLLFRRPLSKNAANRRISHLIKVLLGTTLVHRALAVVTDEPVGRVVAIDLLLIAAILAAAAPSLPKAIWSSVVLCAACAVVAGVLPEHAPVIYAAGTLGFIANTVVRWYLD